MSSRVLHLTGAKYHKSISKRQRRLQTTIEPTLNGSTPLANIDDIPQNTDNDAAFAVSTELESSSINLPCTCLSCMHFLQAPPPAKQIYKWGGWSHRNISVPCQDENAQYTPLALAARAASHSIFGPVAPRPSTPMRNDGWVGTSPLVSAFLSAVHGPTPREWQRDHIAHVATGGDILVATGTGTGKSAVADAAWASSLARLSNRGGVALISAPLLAIVEQTGTRARALAHMGGWNVREVSAGRGTVAAPPARVGDGADALVCTTHRLESIVWEALAADTLSRVCCVVVDEVHCISQDTHAGVALETALTLLLYTRSLAGSPATGLVSAVGSSLSQSPTPAALPTHAHAAPSTPTHPLLTHTHLPQLVLLSASLPTSGPSARAFTRWLGYPRTATAAPRPLALTQLAVCAGGSASGPAGGMVCASDGDGTWVACPEVRPATLCASAGVRGSVHNTSATSSRAVPHTSATPSLLELLHAGAVAVVLEACAAHAPAFLFAASRRDVGGYLTTVAKQLPRALCRALVEAFGQPGAGTAAASTDAASVAATAATSNGLAIAHGAAGAGDVHGPGADACDAALASAVARDSAQARSSAHAPPSAWVWVPGFQPRHSTALDGVGRGFPVRVSVDKRVDGQVHVRARDSGLGGEDLSVGAAAGVQGSALADAAAHATSCLQRAMAAAVGGTSAAGAAQVTGVRRNPSGDASSHAQGGGLGDASRMCLRVLLSEAAVALLRARARLLRQLCVAAPVTTTAATSSSSTTTPTASTVSGATAFTAASPPAADDWCVESVAGPTRDDAPQLERLSAVLAAAAVAATPASQHAAGGSGSQSRQRADASVGVIGAAARAHSAASVVWLDVRHLALHMQVSVAVSVALVLPPCASLAPPSAPRNIYQQRQRPQPCVPQLSLSPLGAAVALGVGAHNAGMSRSQRDHMHHAFARQALTHTITDGTRSLQLSTSVLCSLVCTATVATGVDAPVATVAVLGAKVAGAPMTSGHYQQAIGRAGRREHVGATVSLNSATTPTPADGMQGGQDADAGGPASAALLRDYVDVVLAAQRGRSILFCEHPCRARALSLADAVDSASLRSAMDTGAWASLLSRWVAVRGVCAFAELVSLAEHTLWAVQAAEAEEGGGACATCALQKQVGGALSLLVSHMALFALPSPSTSHIPTRPHAQTCPSPFPSPFAPLLFRPSPLAYASLQHSAPMLDVLVRAHHAHMLRRTLVLAPGAAELHAFATSLAHRALLDPLLHMAAPALAALPPAMLRALGLDMALLTAAARVPEHAPRHALAPSPVVWLDALARVCVAHEAILRHATTTTNADNNATATTHGGTSGGTGGPHSAGMHALSPHAPASSRASALLEVGNLSADAVAVAWASAAAHGATGYLDTDARALGLVSTATGTGTGTGACANVITGPSGTDSAGAVSGAVVGSVVGTLSESATTPTLPVPAPTPSPAALAYTLASLQSALAALHSVAMARANTAALCTAHAHGAGTVAIARASGQSRAALANLWQAAGGALRVAAGEATWSGDRGTALVLSNLAARMKWERER